MSKYFTSIFHEQVILLTEAKKKTLTVHEEEISRKKHFEELESMVWAGAKIFEAEKRHSEKLNSKKK